MIALAILLHTIVSSWVAWRLVVYLASRNYEEAARRMWSMEASYRRGTNEVARMIQELGEPVTPGWVKGEVYRRLWTCRECGRAS